MEVFERQFAELSFKICKLKVSLRMKRHRIMSENISVPGNEIQEEINQGVFGSSPYDSLPEFVSRRSSIYSNRSRLNSVSSAEIQKTTQITKSSVVNTDDELERYF
jgi:hypothetical protein